MTAEATVQEPTTTQETPVAQANDTAQEWSLARRISFRFIFTYFLVWFFPSPFSNLLPVVSESIENFVSHSIWLPIVRVVGKYVLRLPQEITQEVTGSGDKLYDYVYSFTVVCLALLITAIWSFTARHRKHHESLEAAFRIGLRYTLAAIMLGYGAFKVVKLQFPTPGPLQLIKTYGDSSPMNLLWTFMGFSTAYTFFAGFMEVFPSILLFFRRTTLLGALLQMAVLSNVVLLNFCYDVPVKLFSSHLLFMAFLIALPDLQRLWRFFLQNAPTEPAPERKPFSKRWMERARIPAKSLTIAMALGTNVYSAWTSAREYGPLAQTRPLHGTYEVESLIRDGAEVPALLTDAKRMRYVILRGFQDKDALGFLMMNGERRFFLATFDREKKTISLEEGKEGPEKPLKFEFTYTEAGGDLLALEGTLDGAKVQAKLHKLEPNKYLLMNRGFHWVNEVPFNR